MTKPVQSTMSRQRNKTLLGILAAALVVRLGLLLMTEGYSYDMSCFFAWALKMADGGPAAFYSEGYFADYPPAYMLVLGLVGKGLRAFSLSYTGRAAALLLGLVPTLCDCASVAVLYSLARQHAGEKTAAVLGSFAAFCPVLLFDTAVWKQIDGVFSLPVLLCFVLLEKKNYLPAALCYGIALAIKPQALLVGPVLALCFLLPLFSDTQDKKKRLAALKNGVLGVLLALAPTLACGLPFFGGRVLPELLKKYTETSGSYPYAVINAFNWFFALGGNWTAQNQPLLLLSWQQWGVLHLVVLTAALCLLALCSWRRQRFSPMLLAAFYAVGVFTLSHRMHERYLIFGILLALAAAAIHDDRGIFGAAAGLSFTGLVNLAQVYCLAGTDDEWMTGATAQLMGRVCGLAATACFALLTWRTVQLCLGRAGQPVWAPSEPNAKTQPRIGEYPAPQPAWTKKEVLVVLGLTLVTGLVSLTGLGDTKAPEKTLVDTTLGGPQSVTLSVPNASSLWVYTGILGSGTLQVTDATGAVQAEASLNQNSVFKWQEYPLTPSDSYTIVMDGLRVYEISFRDAGGRAIPVADMAGEVDSLLLDEQDSVPDKLSYLNNTYFDEIYHARTAYEMLHGMTVYETTHPPLGKDFILLGVALFGMTGFGWRVVGTLFGVGMVPLFYRFCRRLTRKPMLAGAGAALLALDFMRFAQSRIATIDIYGTFFILLGAACMIWYCQTVLEKGVAGALLPMALSGVAFGLGCASKWTGIYAGAGLAVLYFGVLAARYAQKQPDFGREAALALGGGVLFFVVVPLGIYLLSYLPYKLRDPGFGLEDWWRCQEYMYWYHSALEATHPFESRWYTWALDLRPVWYYGSSGGGQYSSIAGFFNPVVVWGGLAGLAGLGWRQCTGRGSRAGGAVLVLFAAQLLPWMLVTRCTFLYHYFPASVFALAALVLCLNALAEKHPLAARRTAWGLVGGAAVLFVWFYPVLSGQPVGAGWAASTGWLPSWGFYNLG